MHDADIEVLRLLASELVANAVLHGEGPVRLDVHFSPGRVRLAVTDSSTEVPQVRRVTPNATGGRGMALVDELAAAWGCESSARGKTVWFTYEALRKTSRR